MLTTINVLSLIVVLVFLPLNLLGKDHCSLVVKVVNAEEQEIDSVVAVREEDGRLTKKENVAGGVSFCDLGVMPVTVTVGHESCNQVTVRNVPLAWGKTTVVKVIHDRAPCLYDPPPPPVPLCEFLIRIVDSERNPLSGASLKTQIPSDSTYESDRYGRIHLHRRVGAAVEGVVTVEGYRSRNLKLQCSSGRQAREHYVVLEKLPK